MRFLMQEKIMTEKDLSTWTEDVAMAADEEFVEDPDLERRFVAAVLFCASLSSRRN